MIPERERRASCLYLQFLLSGLNRMSTSGIRSAISSVIIRSAFLCKYPNVYSVCSFIVILYPSSLLSHDSQCCTRRIVATPAQCGNMVRGAVRLHREIHTLVEHIALLTHSSG